MGKYFCRLFFRVKGLVEATAAHWGQQKSKSRDVVKTTNLQA